MVFLKKTILFVCVSLAVIGCQEHTEDLFIQENIYSYQEFLNVIDGDTIYFRENGSTRLLNIDTPEKFYSDKLYEQALICSNNDIERIQRMGEFSSLFTKSLFFVSNYYQVQSFGKDVYSREVSIVYLNNGISVNEYLVQEGFAVPNIYNSYLEYNIREAAAYARANRNGLWENYYEEMDCLESLNY